MVFSYNRIMKQNLDGAGTAENNSISAEAACTNILSAADETRKERRRSSRGAGVRGCRSGKSSLDSHGTRDLAALLSAELDEATSIVEDGKSRSVSKRELIASQLVDRSAKADLQATKLLVELLNRIQPEAHSPEAEPLDAADEKVIATILARLGMAE